MSQSGRQKQSDINVPACNVVNECPLAVDIAIESTDGQVFGAHTKNLEVFNRAFPATDSVVHDKPSDIVKLSESSDTLQLLLKFSHNEEHGDISEMGLDKVLEFAAAADKYGNSIAMAACKAAMNHLARQSSENAAKIIPYKCLYSDYVDMDWIVRSTMDLPFPKILGYTRHFPEVYMIYTLYRERWQSSYQTYLTAVDREHDKNSACRTILTADKNPTDAALQVARSFGRRVPIGSNHDSTKEAIMKLPKWSEMSKLAAE